MENLCENLSPTHIKQQQASWWKKTHQSFWTVKHEYEQPHFARKLSFERRKKKLLRWGCSRLSVLIQTDKRFLNVSYSVARNLYQSLEAHVINSFDSLQNEPLLDMTQCITRILNEEKSAMISRDCLSIVLNEIICDLSRHLKNKHAQNVISKNRN